MSDNGGGGFRDFLASQADASAGASFSTKDPHPYDVGVSNNVLGGPVTTGRHRELSPDTETYRFYKPGRVPSSTVTDSATVGQAAQAMFGMSKGAGGEVAALQNKLVAAGLLDKGKYTPGYPDAATAKAYGDLLQENSAMALANTNAAPTIDETLAQRTAAYNAPGAPGALGGAGGAAIKQGRVQQISNPTDLTAQVQQAAQSKLGRKLRQSEITKFVSIYHGLEGAANKRDLAAGATADLGGNSTIVGAPNASVAADDYVQRNNAAEAGAHDVAGQFNNFLSIIKGI